MSEEAREISVRIGERPLTMAVRVYFRAFKEESAEENRYHISSIDMEGVSPAELVQHGLWVIDGVGGDYFVPPSAIIGMRRLDQVSDPVEFAAEVTRLKDGEVH